MQQQAIQQLDDSVSEVFALMLNQQCAPGLCPSPRGLGGLGCISALIAFSGALRGICSIHLTPPTADVITGHLLGAEPDATGTLTADAAGELCNMIAGSWKSRQPLHGTGCCISPPQVTTDTLCNPALPAFAETLSRVYSFEEYCLRLILCFD